VKQRIAAWSPFLACLLCTAVVGPSSAQNDLDQLSHLPKTVIAQIEGLINNHLTTNHVRGLSVAVVVNGRQVFTKGYGFADAEKKQRVRGNTPFELGSVTKSFTAFALLRIYDDPTLIRKPGVNALDLNAPLSIYLSDNADFTLPHAWGDITPTQLLSMTSGIEDFASNTKPWREILHIVGRQPLVFSPGTGWCYSNPNFMILGELIQQLSGMDYADFMQTYVFRPLHLRDTLVHTSEDTPGRLAVGYQWTGTEWITSPPRLPEASFSSGAIISTAFDLGKFLAALAKRKILQPATYDLMWTAVQLPTRSSEWGLGWSVSVTPQHTVYRKDGAVPGYSAQLSIYENHGVSVAIASNANEVPVEQLAAHIAAAVIGVQSVPNPPGPPSDCQ
jgi:CubicO group peptidase (beta-lactamase class C family)